VYFGESNVNHANVISALNVGGGDAEISIDGNNVVLGNPTAVLSVYSPGVEYEGLWDLTACTNIGAIIYLNASLGGVKAYNCTNLEQMQYVNTNAANPWYFSGNQQMYIISRLYGGTNTDLQFLNTLPNPSRLTNFIYENNGYLITADLSNMTGLYYIGLYDNPSLSSLIVNSANLREVDVSRCALTTLDLSCSTILNGIDASGNNLTSITIANGTANNDEAIYDLGSNELSASAINAFFTALGEGTPYDKKGLSPPLIYANNNPGSQTCDPTIATAKSWSVYTGF